MADLINNYKLIKPFQNENERGDQGADADEHDHRAALLKHGQVFHDLDDSGVVVVLVDAGSAG